MGELSSVVGGAYSSAQQASGCPRALAPGRGQPHPNLAPKLMTTCNPGMAIKILPPAHEYFVSRDFRRGGPKSREERRQSKK